MWLPRLTWLPALAGRSLFGAGYWVAPFLVSAGVMALGALIWMFLIDPAKTICDS